MNKPNKLGWITNINVMACPNYIDVTSFGGVDEKIITSTTYEADLHIVANDPGALMKQFNKWMRNGGEMPTYEEEFMCLYCGSPNKIENTHCAKCGAPRSFVIG